jgi:hypothetical protein
MDTKRAITLAAVVVVGGIGAWRIATGIIDDDNFAIRELGPRTVTAVAERECAVLLAVLLKEGSAVAAELVGYPWAGVQDHRT